MAQGLTRHRLRLLRIMDLLHVDLLPVASQCWQMRRRGVRCLRRHGRSDVLPGALHLFLHCYLPEGGQAQPPQGSPPHVPGSSARPSRPHPRQGEEGPVAERRCQDHRRQRQRQRYAVPEGIGVRARTQAPQWPLRGACTGLRSPYIPTTTGLTAVFWSTCRVVERSFSGLSSTFLELRQCCCCALVTSPPLVRPLAWIVAYAIGGQVRGFQRFTGTVTARVGEESPYERPRRKKFNAG